MYKKTKTIRFTKILTLFLFLFLATPVYGATNLDIGTACTDNSECKTGLCEQSSLTSTPNKFCACSTAQHCEDKYTKATDETWECKAKSPQSQGLAYCQSDKNGIKYPITAASTTEKPKTEEPDVKVTMKPPKISIPIPDLPEWAEIDVSPGTQVNVPYLAQYIIAIYKYALVIGSIMAVAALMIGGVMYMMGGMNATMITKAKTLIFGSISGLVILISSSLILNLINPNLTQLSEIQIDTIEGIAFEDESTDAIVWDPVDQAAMAALVSENPDLLAPGQFGAYNKSATCTPENVIALAKTYAGMKICFGPCHCASTVFRILRGSKCVVSASGGAARGVTVLERNGWMTVPCSTYPKNKIPVGYLYTTGHAMLSIGGGRLVESSTDITRCWKNPGLKKTCDAAGKEAYTSCREEIKAKTKSRADYCEMIQEDQFAYKKCIKEKSTIKVCKLWQKFEFDTCAIKNGECPGSGPRSTGKNYCTSCSKIPDEAPYTCRFSAIKNPTTGEGCRGSSSCNGNQCLYQGGSRRVGSKWRNSSCTITFKPSWASSGNVKHTGSVYETAASVSSSGH